VSTAGEALTRDRRWWLADKGEVHHRVCAVAERLIDASTSRHELDLRHARLYGNWRYLGLSPTQYARRLDTSDRLTLNLISSVIDTACSKIAQNKPAPRFVPEGGDWGLRRKAKRLNKFGKGVLRASGTYAMRLQAFRDACVFGTGIAKVLSRGDQLRTERRFPWELLVDEQEAIYGEPRTLVERRYIDKAVMLERFGGSKGSKAYATILEASPSDRETPSSGAGLAEQIEVFEAWHLPSAKGAKDGRHVIVMQDLTLLDEPWTREQFPFAFFHWSEPVAGFWGTGMAERLTGIQMEINRLLQRIQEAHKRLGIPWVILDESAGIPKSHITNGIGAILVKSGAAPAGGEVRVQVNQTMHPEIYAHLWTLEEKGYAQEGISQAYATGRKPVGLNSGIAQRERNDIESERFILVGQRWEQWHLDVVEIALQEVRELGDSFQLTAPGRKWGEKINWGQVAMARDSYNLEVWPVSILPQTPAARLEKAQELFASGLMPADALAEALDLPDVEKAHGRVIAAAEKIEWAIDRMLDDDIYTPPEPFDNVEMAIQRATAAYLEEQVQGCPEDRLQHLRDYVEDCQAMQADAAKAGQPAAAPMGDPMSAAPSPELAPGMPSAPGGPLAGMTAVGSA
jgi:hypothetical protein